MSEWDDLCERLALRTDGVPKHKRTLTFETYESGDVLVTCATYPLLAVVGATPLEAFHLASYVADDMDRHAQEIGANNNAVPAVILRHQVVDGVHFFTSPDIPGLCAAHKDRDLAARAVGRQLAELLNARDAQDTAPPTLSGGRRGR